MELLNISFGILLIKLTVSVLPLTLSIYILLSSEETKREIRSVVCRALFNINNAIPMRSFNRIIFWVGGLGVLFGLVSGWFLIIKPYLS